MKLDIKHIQKRGNSYFFRFRIPEALRKYYDGKREIKQTLKTTDPTLAFVRANELSHKYMAQFELLRSCQPIPIESVATTTPQTAFTQVIPIQAPPAQPAPPEPTTPLLSEVLEEMNTARTRQEKTKVSRTSAIRLLTDWHGESIKKPDVAEKFGFGGKNPWKENKDKISFWLEPFFEVRTRELIRKS
jgi:hypothetical protein